LNWENFRRTPAAPRYAPGEAGLAVGPVGQTVIACREHKTGHQIDVLALARGSRPRTPGAPVAFN